MSAEEPLSQVLMKTKVWITEKMKMLGKPFENKNDCEDERFLEIEGIPEIWSDNKSL
jgi:hypothetical protein